MWDTEETESKREKYFIYDGITCLDYITSVIDEWNMSTEHLWNDSNRVQLKCSEKNLSQDHFVHHKKFRHLSVIRNVHLIVRNCSEIRKSGFPYEVLL
jgi:hypothetical protein